MYETELGMVTEAKKVQPLKAVLPMLVTELGMVTEVSPQQLEKAAAPIVVTELEMSTLDKAIQSLYLQIALCQRLIH